MPRVSAKRQIPLPIALCREVGIEPGDDYRCFVAGGRITIVRKEAGAARGFRRTSLATRRSATTNRCAAPLTRVEPLTAVDDLLWQTVVVVEQVAMLDGRKSRLQRRCTAAADGKQLLDPGLPVALALLACETNGLLVLDVQGHGHLHDEARGSPTLRSGVWLDTSPHSRPGSF